jgi:hypothetical protein
LLYVETNVILGYAMNRSVGFDSLLNHAGRLAVPEVCLMEAITTAKSIAVARSGFVKAARMQQGEIDRTKHHRPARDFVASIDEAISASDKVGFDFQLRLYTGLTYLRSRATIVASSEAWFADYDQRGTRISDPTDELILATIRDHAAKVVDPPTLFFSEDNGYARPSVLRSFESVGIRFTASVDEPLEHLAKGTL